MVDFKQNITSLQRRFNNVDYSLVPLNPEFEELENKYRKLRDAISVYKESVETLLNYEHGGKNMKTIMDGLKTVGNRFKKDLFSTEDFYIQKGLVLAEIDKLMPTDPQRNKYSTALIKIGEAKKEMNDVLRKEINTLQEQHNESDSIDKLRTNLKNSRYRLVKIKEKQSSSENSRLDAENGFNALVEECKNRMGNFVGSSISAPVNNSIKNILNAHFKFSEVEYNLLKDALS